MQRLKIMPQQYVFIVAYDGARFHGWQRQHTNQNSTNDDILPYKRPTIEGMRKRPRVDVSTGERLPFTSLNYKNITVQDCLECAILQWLSTVTATASDNTNNPNDPSCWSLEDLNLRVAGRTDKGVHAKGQVIAVQFPDTLPNRLEPWQIQKGIHGRLPIDISIQRVYRHTTTTATLRPTTDATTSSVVDDLFDPRRDVKLKQYSYTIKYQRQELVKYNDSTTASIPSVGAQTFRMALDDSPCLWSVHEPLNDHLLPKVCQELKGTHDYSVFVHKAARDEQDNHLAITRFDFEVLHDYQAPTLYLLEDNDTVNSSNNNSNNRKNEPKIVLGRFIVEGQRFRRTMVRNLVGFAVDVARGKQSLESIASLWVSSKDGAGAPKIHSAPPTGLCLEFVKY